ncbi:DUF3289 family protein [Pantoea sp. B65]|uniref:DUF3289 family protein n=1 Tax=Pantoea sp. B65 TaxID=2813359 RepID=UPI0039B648D7
MRLISFPLKVFSTQNRMNDYSAPDMRCGDLTENQLRNQYKLTDVSSKIEPYSRIPCEYPIMLPARSLTRKPKSHTIDRAVSKEECASLLFDEMRELSTLFATGRYAHLIDQMITHFHRGKGNSFSSSSLDEAYNRVIHENPLRNTLNALRVAIAKNINYSKRTITEVGFFLSDAKNKIFLTRLPKFDRWSDCVNGLGITVHEIHAQTIKINSLVVDSSNWTAEIEFNAQDHFGLDDKDINNNLYRSFRFFRIWFVLQRYQNMAFKPFMTNFSTKLTLRGYRNENLF